MSGWIGRDLERLRKLRGLRREDVAAQLSVSPSTIRNIEHDERYNISLDLLRQIAEVLGATVTIAVSVTEPDAAGDETRSAERLSEGVDDGRRVVTNDYFIHRIRSQYPACPLTNSQIGRRMWQFAQSRGAERVKGRKQLKRAGVAAGVSDETVGPGRGYREPTIAVEYTVRERDVVFLERFAERLGRAYKDPKGRMLVPVR